MVCSNTTRFEGFTAWRRFELSLPGLQDPYFPTHADRKNFARDHIPLQRPGKDYPVAEDVAYPVVLLCSDRMSHVTGVELHVNGGEYIQC